MVKTLIILQIEGELPQFDKKKSKKIKGIPVVHTHS